MTKKETNKKDAQKAICYEKNSIPLFDDLGLVLLT